MTTLLLRPGSGSGLGSVCIKSALMVVEDSELGRFPQISKFKKKPQWDIQKHKIRYQTPKAPSSRLNWLLLLDLIKLRWVSHHMDSDWEIFQNTEVNSGFVMNKTLKSVKDFLGKELEKISFSPINILGQENRGKENQNPFSRKSFPTLNTKLTHNFDCHFHSHNNWRSVSGFSTVSQ